MSYRLPPAATGSDHVAARRERFAARRAATGGKADPDAPDATFPVAAVAAAAVAAGFGTYIAERGDLLAGMSTLPSWLATGFVFAGLFGMIFVALRMASPFDRRRSDSSDSGSGWFDRDRDGCDDGDSGDGGGDGGGD